MSTICTQFGPVTNFEITLNGLATGAARSSAKIENQNLRYVDAICQFKIKPASGSLGDRYGVYFFAWGAADDASPIYPAGVTGVDEAVSVTLETLSIREIGSLYVPASGILISPPFSVAQAFGNVLPPVWGVVAVNRCGLALDATDNTAFWRGVQFEVI
ncbi:MAG: hypothetical protein IT165_01370 [Bryobacterales bacterium]|nr:hypothetical protein [Bryobacterales bacterium]